ncbi:MAG: type II secretion system F family protein [Campylobacterota bacterium]|nr:type II secretion system F family protein [Campylobacterota bacterium]
MKYKITYQIKHKIKTIVLEADSVELLKNLPRYPNNIIKIVQLTQFKNRSFFKVKNDKKNIYELFKQLSIMLNSNLTFNDAITLLINSEKDKKNLQLLHSLDRAVKTSKDIDVVLKPYLKLLGKTTIMFIKMGLENSNIKEAVNSVVILYEQDLSSKEKLKDALRYPFVLLLSLAISVCMIFLYVIPNFEYIFKILGDDLPLSTKILLWVQTAFSEYFVIFIIFFMVLSYTVIYLRKRYKFLFDKSLILHIPIISELIKNYYYYRLFLSMWIIVSSKYNFQLAVEHSKNITSNQFIIHQINKITHKIKNGRSIAQAFEDSKIFDELTVKLLYTAQHTANYEQVLKDISKLYKERFEQSVKNFSLFFEPFMILIIAMMVLWLILAIMVPMWSMSSVL